jgi:hypothetical protein
MMMAQCCYLLQCSIYPSDVLPEASFISSHLISDILSHCSLFRSSIHNTDMARDMSTDALYVVGLAHAYPQYSLGTQEFNDLIIRLYPGVYKNLGYIYLITTIVSNSNPCFADYKS